MSKVSVIVPIYNAEKYLKVCLDSLINQTLRDIDIILVDDGSSDNSGKICVEYAAKDSRICIIHKKNQGSSSARNIGLEYALGEWITFVDSDDWIELNALECAVSIAEKNKVDILQWNYFKNIDDKQIKRESIYPDIIVREGKDIELFQLDVLYPDIDKLQNKVSVSSIRNVCTKLFNANLIKKNKIKFPIEFDHGEDALFCFLAFQYSNKVMLINKYWYHYRTVESSVTHSYKNYRLKAFENEFKVFKYVIQEYNKDNRFLQLYYYYICENFSNSLLVYFFHKDNPNSLRFRLKELNYLIENEYYQSAFSNIDVSILNWRQKIIHYFVNKKLILMLLLLCKLNNFLKKRNN